MTLQHTPQRDGIVTRPENWAYSPGYEFWAYWGHADLVTVMSSTNDGLSGYGWGQAIAANAAVVEGSAGDFLSSADHDPTYVGIGSTNLSMSSPRIFGGYDHGLQASRFLGKYPTHLCMEAYARFAVASANENTAFIGFHTDTATDITAASGVAGIMSDGANFRLKSDTGDDAGAAIDTSWHLFRIEIDSSNVTWFIDNVSQGTIPTLGDVFPTCWRLQTTTTNRVQCAWVRVYYR